MLTVRKPNSFIDSFWTFLKPFFKNLSKKDLITIFPHVDTTQFVLNINVYAAKPKLLYFISIATH